MDKSCQSLNFYLSQTIRQVLAHPDLDHGTLLEHNLVLQGCQDTWLLRDWNNNPFLKNI